MSPTTSPKTTIATGLDPNVLTRTLEEGYGPGAWHGADLKAALADVDTALAFWRPSPARHNIAEIAVHHAYYVRAVRAQLTGTSPEPFALEGDDWFELSDETSLTWAAIRNVVDTEQNELFAAVADLAGRGATTALSDADGFDLVLGITCHAVYHAGQVQLLKRLHAE